MGVYLPSMEMPESCHECVAGHGGCCYVVTAEADGICPDHGRPDWCPLVPIQPHGDLIDRDALLDTATIHWSQTTNESCFPIDEIEYAPTIIPAEEDEA